MSHVHVIPDPEPKPDGPLTWYQTILFILLMALTASFTVWLIVKLWVSIVHMLG